MNWGVILRWRAGGDASSPELGVESLRDAPRSGQPLTRDDEMVYQVVAKTLNETPPDAAHWSVRSAAEAVGVTRSFVHRVWQTFELKRPSHAGVQNLTR